MTNFVTLNLKRLSSHRLKHEKKNSEHKYEERDSGDEEWKGSEPFEDRGGMESLTRIIQERIKLPEIFNNTSIFTIVAVTALTTFILLDLYLYSFVTSFPPGTILPISSNTSNDPCYASPFCQVNVKSLLLDPPDFYVHIPLSSLFIKGMDFANSYQFITPNIISFTHVPVALLASKLISHDSLCTRRVGVLLFQFRNFLDSVDGLVARARRTPLPNPTARSLHNASDSHHRIILGTTPVAPNLGGILQTENLGYWVDGICDSLGGIFLYLACFFYLQKHPVRKWGLFSYTPLPVVISSRNGSQYSTINSTQQGTKDKCRNGKSKGNLNGAQSNYFTRQIICSIHRSGFMSILFGFQALFGSIAWNRFISSYTLLLERNSLGPHPHNLVKASLIHSPIMWMVILAWRYVNPHTWVEILLMAIFFDRMGELLYLFRFWGFVVIFVAACLTEAHLRYAQSLF